MNWLPKSLAARVITFSTIWAIVALVLIATVVSTLFREASERGFDSLLSANLFNLVASVGAGEDGQLTGAPGTRADLHAGKTPQEGRSSDGSARTNGRWSPPTWRETLG